MGGIPSGTVTFLFTDVAGSTRLWEEDRSGMETSLTDHDRMVREAIRANGGIVFATGGDSFSAAFPTAIDAVHAAVSAQLALEGHRWVGPRISVRMGIHTGEADERDGNYFGPAVTRAARIMALGKGRQTLLSEASASLIRDLLADPVSLADLGMHDLKDMERSEHVYEVRHPGLPLVGSPLASTSFRGAHLPEMLTSFVGRSAELDVISELIASSRVVTLTGVGGTGKTRLAVEAARVAADSFADGAWMTELAPVTDTELVLTQIADLWGLRPGEGVSLIKVVSTFLSTRQLLLVVDNCEHVLDEVNRLMVEMLPASPGLRVLATSRESLGVPGEAVYRVPSMALPVDEQQALSSDAVALFLDRFRATRPDYSPTEEDLAAIVQVCRRLDAIPLGLELAAARLRSMSPPELAERLNESFRILTGASKTALPRQRTLQATIDWSYDLLEPGERSVFRKASCFLGGFDLDAAIVVAGDGDLEEWEVLDLIDQLVDKSLLNASLGETGSRFRMLEPIRQYAQERLTDEREAERAHAAHAAYYAGLVAGAAPRLRSSEQAGAHQTLRLELDNIRASLHELRDSGHLDEFLQMSFDLAIFWMQASMQIEGLEFLHSALDTDPDADSTLLAKAWWAASVLAFNLTDPDSVDYAKKGMALAEAAGDDVALGWTSLMTAAAMRGTTGGSDADEYYARGRALIDRNPDRPWWDETWDRIFLGWIQLFMTIGSASERWANLTATVDAARSVGDQFLVGGVMTGAYFLRESDDDPRALAYLEEAVRILDGMGFRHSQGHALVYWGWMTRSRATDGAGASALTRGAEMLAEVGDIPCALNHSSDLVGYLVDSGKVEQAVPHIAFMARQARADSLRFTPLVAAAASRAVTEAGDDTTAALIDGYRGAGSPMKGDDTGSRAGGSGAHAELRARGALMSAGEILDLVGSWAQKRQSGPWMTPPMSEVMADDADYDHGGPKHRGFRLEGEMHGSWEFYRRDGSIMRSGKFDRGRQVGIWRTFDRSGAVVKTTEFPTSSG